MTVDPTLIGRRCVSALAPNIWAGIIRAVYMGVDRKPTKFVGPRPALQFLVERDRELDGNPVGSMFSTPATEVALEEPCPGCGKPMEHYGPRFPVMGQDCCSAFCSAPLCHQCDKPMDGGILAGVNNYCSAECLIKGEAAPTETGVQKGDRLPFAEHRDVDYNSAADETPYPKPGKCHRCALPYLAASYDHTICNPCMEVAYAANLVAVEKMDAKRAEREAKP